jgi:hypothetical protein
LRYFPADAIAGNVTSPTTLHGACQLSEIVKCIDFNALSKVLKDPQKQVLSNQATGDQFLCNAI